MENAVGFTSQELSGKTETFTLWILTILSLLKSPGRKKKKWEKRLGGRWGVSREPGEINVEKTQRPGVMEARKENESRSRSGVSDVAEGCCKRDGEKWPLFGSHERCWWPWHACIYSWAVEKRVRLKWLESEWEVRKQTLSLDFVRAVVLGGEHGECLGGLF